MWVDGVAMGFVVMALLVALVGAPLWIPAVLVGVGGVIVVVAGFVEYRTIDRKLAQMWTAGEDR